MEIHHPHLNSLWATLIVEELVRTGVTHAIIAPGSRNSPLVAACARNSRVRCVVHFDERGAGFYAVGLARATGKPAAVLCTSGTAVSELSPAVTEADRAKVPILLLTADRPPELRSCHANQTIDQVEFFGDRVRWFFDLPSPERSVPPEAVLTAVDNAVYRSVAPPRGPVHLNCMFREPLAPVGPKKDFSEYMKGLQKWCAGQDPYTRYVRAEPDASSEAQYAFSLLKDTERVVVVVGELVDAAQRDAAASLAQKLTWPVLPDILSGLRLGQPEGPFCPFFDHLLACDAFRQAHAPKAVLHLGGPVVSKQLLLWLEELGPETYIVVADHPERQDPVHRATVRFDAPIPSFCEAFSSLCPSASETEYLSSWLRADREARRAVEAAFQVQKVLSEPFVLWQVSGVIPSGHFLWLGNSMPVRDAALWSDPRGYPVPVFCNRGASGIDGTVASICGFATGSGAPGTAVVGDLALLHDLNSLALLSKLSLPVVLVVLNNRGGGIFSFLPIAACADIFKPFWQAPHPFRFQKAAEQFQLPYRRPDTRTQFEEIYHEALISGEPTLIELESDSERNREIHQHLERAVAGTISKVC